MGILFFYGEVFIKGASHFLEEQIPFLHGKSDLDAKVIIKNATIK